MDSTTIKIPAELFASAESSSYSGVFMPEALHTGPDAYRFEEPLSWSVLVSNTGGALLVSGTVSGQGQTDCSRCLEPIEVPISGEVEGYFLLEDAEAEFEEGAEEEFDVLGEDDTIDLAALLEAAILVDLPLQPLCKSDCSGLCPDCGANLNEGACDCASRRAREDAAAGAAQNPFAKLRELEF